MLGGKIQVESTLGQGSHFTFTVQFTAADKAEMSSESDKTEPQQPAKTDDKPTRISLSGHVLVVDDGPDNRRLVSYILKKSGVKVSLAENGKEAFDLLTKNPPDGTERPVFDLVLMDMQMPEMDGYTATRKSREAGYRGPIVALTANAMHGDREKCLDAGCEDYASKPIVRSTFLELVAHYLSLSGNTSGPTGDKLGQDATEAAVDAGPIAQD